MYSCFDCHCASFLLVHLDLAVAVHQQGQVVAHCLAEAVQVQRAPVVHLDAALEVGILAVHQALLEEAGILVVLHLVVSHHKDLQEVVRSNQGNMGTHDSMGLEDDVGHGPSTELEGRVEGAPQVVVDSILTNGWGQEADCSNQVALQVFVVDTSAEVEAHEALDTHLVVQVVVHLLFHLPFREEAQCDQSLVEGQIRPFHRPFQVEAQPDLVVGNHLSHPPFQVAALHVVRSVVAHRLQELAVLVVEFPAVALHQEQYQEVHHREQRHQDPEALARRSMDQMLHQVQVLLRELVLVLVAVPHGPHLE